MSRWTLTCSTWVRRRSGDCVTCCLLRRAEMEWGTPSKGVHLNAADFRRILRDSGTPIFFQCQKDEEKSAENMMKNVGRKNLGKNGRKSAQKSAHRKSAQTTGSNIPVSRKMEARKKNTKKKICAKLAQNHSPKRPRERGGGKGSACLSKTLQKSPFKTSQHTGDPLAPIPFFSGPGRREGEWESFCRRNPWTSTVITGNPNQ